MPKHWPSKHKKKSAFQKITFANESEHVQNSLPEQLHETHCTLHMALMLALKC